MTNEELAQAIEVADKRVKECRTGQGRYAIYLEHLKNLLAEQSLRAVAAQPQAPIAPAWTYPVFVQPTWVPQPALVPPFIVTC